MSEDKSPDVFEDAGENDDEDLTAAEAKAVAGGISDVCFAVGFGSGSEACSDGEYCGANSCSMVGYGFLSS